MGQHGAPQLSGRDKDAFDWIYKENIETQIEDSQALQVQLGQDGKCSGAPVELACLHGDLSSGMQWKSTIFNTKCWHWKHIQWEMHLKCWGFSLGYAS